MNEGQTYRSPGKRAWFELTTDQVHKQSPIPSILEPCCIGLNKRTPFEAWECPFRKYIQHKYNYHTRSCPLSNHERICTPQGTSCLPFAPVRSVVTSASLAFAWPCIMNGAVQETGFRKCHSAEQIRRNAHHFIDCSHSAVSSTVSASYPV